MQTKLFLNLIFKIHFTAPQKNTFYLSKIHFTLEKENINKKLKNFVSSKNGACSYSVGETGSPGDVFRLMSVIFHR